MLAAVDDKKNKRKRKYPGLSQSQVIARNRSGYKNPEVWNNRVCIVCNGTKTLMSSRRRDSVRLDGEKYSLYPVWHRSKLMEGKYECRWCYNKGWYQKNKDWIRSRQKRWRLQRKKLMSKMLSSLRKIDKKKKNKAA